MPDDAEGGDAESGQIHLLYVDDERGFAELAAEFLQRASEAFEITIESSVEAGLERLTAERFDCIVSDYDMPGQDGLDFLKAAREREPGIPFVLVTGKGSEEIASEAISAGVTDYLQKRGGRERYELLANRIRNAVAQHRAQREAATHQRVSELVRDVTRSLVGAASRDEVEQAVCDHIAASEPYLFAWVGAADPVTEQVRARTSAGVDDGYLDEITVSVGDEPTGRGPAGTALRDGVVSVAQDVQNDPSFAPWRDEALERGFQSVVGVPLSHDGNTYGVLTVYAAHPYAFDERECELLRDLGAAVGHALEAMAVHERLEQQYHDLFEMAPVMYALTREEDGWPVVTSCNQRFLERLGYDRDEVVGRSLDELYTPESAAKLLDEGGYSRALDGEFTQEERQLVTAGGDVVETLLRAAPRYDDAGRIVGTLTLFVDVTDRRRAQAAALQAEAMEAAIDGMAVIAPDGTYQYVNDAHAQMYGYDADELVGQTWQTLYDDDVVEEFETEVLPVVESGKEWRGERVGQHADGSQFPQELSISPLANGEALWVVRDITERKRAERELERQNARLDEFASLVSHDLRGPLNVAQGNVFLAQEMANGEASDRLATTADALDRMEHIISDMLSLAHGHDASDRHVVSLAETVADCWHGDDQVIVTEDLRFEADRSRLQRLLENLFRNSVEHGSTGNRPEAGDSVEHGSTSSRATPDDSDEHGSPPDGAIEIRVGPLDSGEGFFVEDNGCGISADEREAAFETGYSTAARGTGLGLDIVGRIVEEHGWTSRLTESTDGGVRFEVRDVTVVDHDDTPVSGAAEHGDAADD